MNEYKKAAKQLHYLLTDRHGNKQLVCGFWTIYDKNFSKRKTPTNKFKAISHGNYYDISKKESIKEAHDKFFEFICRDTLKNLTPAIDKDCIVEVVSKKIHAYKGYECEECYQCLM